ncbi:hypothetical protein FPV67DRAFT_582938 [Lyophyllum atratum]|nr:hypothetical protein FPV67DRAFT_582938 [Lyophyllum atratum]
MSELVPTSFAIPSLGPIFIGNLLNYAFMGVLVVQVYFYSLAFKSDRLPLKALVGLVLGLDIIQTGFSTHCSWDVLIVSWGDMAHVQEQTWSVTTLAPMAGSVAFVVQCYYAWRVWILGAHHRITLPIVSLICLSGLASFIMSLCYGIAMNLELSVIASHLQAKFLVAWLSTSMVCDLLITITLVIQLHLRRNQHFRFVNEVVHRTIRMAIETGALTCGIAIAELASYGRSTYFNMLIILCGKVYSNSLLASLNSRAPILRKDEPADKDAWQIYEEHISSSRSWTARSTQVELRIEFRKSMKSKCAEHGRNTMDRRELPITITFLPQNVSVGGRTRMLDWIGGTYQDIN